MPTVRLRGLAAMHVISWSAYWMYLPLPGLLRCNAVQFPQQATVYCILKNTRDKQVIANAQIELKDMQNAHTSLEFALMYRTVLFMQKSA